MITRSRAWLTLFLAGTDLFVVSPLIPQVARSFGVTPGTAGWMVSAFSLAYIAGGPWFGAIADRRGRRPVLIGALCLFTVANAATGLAPGLAALLASRAAAGLAASGVTPSVYALVSASAPPQRQGRWLATATSGLLIALVTGAPAGALLSSVIGWRGVFGCVAGACVLVTAMNLWTVRAGPARGPDGTQRPGGAAVPMGAAVPIAAAVRAVSVTSLWALAVYGFYTYLGTGLSGTARFGTGQVAAAIAVYGVCAVAGNLAGGPLADRLGGWRVTAASLAALAAAGAGFAVAVNSALAGPAKTAVVAGILGLFALTAYPYFTAQQMRLVRSFPQATGRLLAWNNTAMYVGIFIGSAAGGRLLAGGGFRVLCLSSAAVGALGAVSTRWAIGRGTRRRPPDGDRSPDGSSWAGLTAN
jgi:predicted MFS family arabinose efflux permease